MSAPFTLTDLVQALERSGNAVALLASHLSDDEARWQPGPGRWSALEIINHLADEESADFRTRLALLLHAPREAWPPIDPQRWVQQRRYNERSLLPSVERFLTERQASLQQLLSWAEPEWQARRGSLSAADLAASWQAHDLLHLRQLAEVRYLYLETQGYNLEYAGMWPGLRRSPEEPAELEANA
ncbi:DinB family protein [Deinococcus irradiatisoli]|uniref:DinB family protein n=1 Tax=Deinococcus irradiatisoli TaxID=2202254 RepID=A0A2Z3JFG1_9DEIO|nr:DinB family protein [Deinococcus irradiatisoli]AWN22736.1 DinB family protein [Deinococcus irradiatisoli]